MLHARIVGEDIVAALAVAEKTNNAGMRAVEDANDSALGPLWTRTGAGAKDFGEDVVAVHGVLDGVAGDKDVAGILGGGDIGDDKTIAVVVEDESAGQFIAAGVMVPRVMAAGGGGVVRAGLAGMVLSGGLGGIFFPF